MRLINADALKDEMTKLRDLSIKRIEDTPASSPFYRTYSAQAVERKGFIQMIDETPTVNPICPYLSDGEVKQPCIESPCERPQGEWIIVKNERYGNNVKCPFCGKELAGTDLNFCCKCGADMRKEAENATKEAKTNKD